MNDTLKNQVMSEFFKHIYLFDDPEDLIPPEEQIIKGLLALEKNDLKNVNSRTISFLYDWVSFGPDADHLDVDKIWTAVLNTSRPHPDIPDWRVAYEPHPNCASSFTRSEQAVEHFKESYSGYKYILSCNAKDPDVLYYPLCDAAMNLKSHPDQAPVVEEIINKAKAECEYVVLENYCIRYFAPDGKEIYI